MKSRLGWTLRIAFVFQCQVLSALGQPEPASTVQEIGLLKELAIYLAAVDSLYLDEEDDPVRTYYLEQMQHRVGEIEASPEATAESKAMAHVYLALAQYGSADTSKVLQEFRIAKEDTLTNIGSQLFPGSKVLVSQIYEQLAVLHPVIFDLRGISASESETELVRHTRFVRSKDQKIESLPYEADILRFVEAAWARQVREAISNEQSLVFDVLMPPGRYEIDVAPDEKEVFSPISFRVKQKPGEGKPKSVPDTVALEFSKPFRLVLKTATGEAIDFSLRLEKAPRTKNSRGYGLQDTLSEVILTETNNILSYGHYIVKEFDRPRGVESFPERVAFCTSSEDSVASALEGFKAFLSTKGIGSSDKSPLSISGPKKNLQASEGQSVRYSRQIAGDEEQDFEIILAHRPFWYLFSRDLPPYLTQAVGVAVVLLGVLSDNGAIAQ